MKGVFYFSYGGAVRQAQKLALCRLAHAKPTALTFAFDCHSERRRSACDGIVEESRRCVLYPCSIKAFARECLVRTPCSGILRLARAFTRASLRKTKVYVPAFAHL